MNRARAEYLRIAAESMDTLLQELSRNAIAYSVNTTGAYGEVSRGKGGVPVSKVESLALTLADGELPPDLDTVRRDIESMRQECAARNRMVGVVDAWLGCLNAQESYVIRARVIDGQIWRHVIDGYQSQFGEFASRSTLKDTLARARCKIYAIAS